MRKNKDNFPQDGVMLRESNFTFPTEETVDHFPQDGVMLRESNFTFPTEEVEDETK